MPRHASCIVRNIPDSVELEYEEVDCIAAKLEFNMRVRAKGRVIPKH